MRSFLSLLRPETEPSGDEPSAEPARDSAPVLAALAPPLAIPEVCGPEKNLAFTPDQALDNMLDCLEALVDVLPTKPSISVASVTERPLALGNHRGTERRGTLAVVELKGGRLDAVVRFQFVADRPDAVDTAVTALQGHLLAAKDVLWVAGFLRITAGETSLAEHVPVLNDWRRIAHYQILYEYHYLDPESAESIIARIPIHSDPEERDSLVRETTIVSDEMVRWDSEGAPPLEVTGSVASRVRVIGLASLAHMPAGWTGNQVTLARLDRGSAVPPTQHPTLAAFLAAVTDKADPDHHAQVTFASVADFLAEFESAGDPIELGDWGEDGTLDVYQPSTLRLGPPIRLGRGDDLIRLSYQDATFDAPAVVYLRVEVRGV